MVLSLTGALVPAQNSRSNAFSMLISMCVCCCNSKLWPHSVDHVMFVLCVGLILRRSFFVRFVFNVIYSNAMRFCICDFFLRFSPFFVYFSPFFPPFPLFFPSGCLFFSPFFPFFPLWVVLLSVPICLSRVYRYLLCFGLRWRFLFFRQICVCL